MRTALYYPTISVPASSWLRQALFYFDKVASIAPKALWDEKEKKLDAELSPELEYLEKEHIYEPIFPEKLTGDIGGIENPHRQNWKVAFELQTEFKIKLEDANFRAGPSSKFVRVYNGKLHGSLLPFLEEKGLLKYEPQEQKYQTEWLWVEERSALLYLSMLAQSLSDIHPSTMVPGTDQPESEELIFHARSRENGFPSIETRLRSVIPVPRPEVPFSKIVDFKRKREPELLAYRLRIEELHGSLRAAPTAQEVKHALTVFQETQSKDLANLKAALSDANIATFWGSFKTLTSANSPTLWGAVAVAAGAAASVATLPITLLVAGTLVKGAIDVRSYWVDERNKRRAVERASPFSYLHYAKQEGLLR